MKKLWMFKKDWVVLKEYPTPLTEGGKRVNEIPNLRLTLREEFITFRETLNTIRRCWTVGDRCRQTTTTFNYEWKVHFTRTIVFKKPE